jgi:hypothetical protein
MSCNALNLCAARFERCLHLKGVTVLWIQGRCPNIPRGRHMVSIRMKLLQSAILADAVVRVRAVRRVAGLSLCVCVPVCVHVRVP